MDYFPDPRTVIEDDADRQRYERDMAERLKRQEEERLLQVAQNLARKEERAKKREEMLAAKMNGEGEEDEDDMEGSERGSHSGSAQTPQGTSSKNRSGSQDSGSQDNSDQLDNEDIEDQDDEEYDGGVGDLPSAPEMQQELIMAINDEREEYETLKR